MTNYSEVLERQHQEFLEDIEDDEIVHMSSAEPSIEDEEEEEEPSRRRTEEQSWKILKKDASTSIFTKKKMREYTPYGRVLGFIQANLGISYRNNSKYDALLKNTRITCEQDQMGLYKNNYNRIDDYFHTSYSLAKHSYGRVTPNGYLSLSIFRRSTRHTFADGEYRDIDMKNCQPVAVYEKCQQMGLEDSVPSLKKYCEKTKHYREKIMEVHTVNKDTAKELPIRILFGGSYDEWITENGVDKNTKIKTFIHMETQLKLIMEIVYRENPQMVKDLSKDSTWNKKTLNAKKRSVMGLWGQTMERFFQETAILFLVEDKGFILEDIIPSQDGFMVRPQYWYDGIEADCSQAVKDKYNFNIVFEEKQFDEKFELVEINSEKNVEKWQDALSVKLLANRLIDEYGNFILRNRESGELFIYWENRWYNESSDKNKRYIWRFVSEKLYDLIEPEINEDVSLKKQEKDMLLQMLRNHTSQKVRMNEVILHSVSKCNEMTCEFDSNPFLIGFNDCVYDLEDGEPRQYDYSDFMTLSVGYDYPHHIDSNLDVTDEENINIKETLIEFFESIQPDKDDMRLLFQTLASGLDGIAYQNFFFFNGKGGNGKGTIGGLMAIALGEYYYQGGTAILKECEKLNAPSPEILLLKNKRYVNFKELEGVLNVSVLRNLTGGGKFSGRMLNANPVNFEMNATFVAEFNNYPDFSGKPMEADYRRVIDERFKYGFTSDPDKIGKNLGGQFLQKANLYFISNKFKETSRDMFMMMLLKTYREHRIETGMHFEIPKESVKRANDYLANQNVFKRLTDNIYEKIEILDTDSKKDKAEKTLKASVMWKKIQYQEDYRTLTAREKKNTYGRDNFYQHLKEEFSTDIQKKSALLVCVGVRDKSFDDEEVESDEEED